MRPARHVPSLLGLLVVLLSHSLHAGAKASDDPILTLLDRYREAMEARSTEKLAAVVAPDLVVLEGTYKNVGWEDYRDNHIGKEMQDWKRFRVSDPKVVKIERSDSLAYVIVEETDEIETASDTTRLRVAQTFVLKKGREGWRIQHLHLSAKKEAPPK